MALLSGLEQLLGLKKKQQAKPAPRSNGRGPTPPDITYNPNPNTNIPYSTHTMPLAVAPPMAQAQGYPGNPDDVDQFGAVGRNPQLTVAPQRVVQPTMRPFQLQASGPGDTTQYGTNPQLVDLRRRILGF